MQEIQDRPQAGDGRGAVQGGVSRKKAKPPSLQTSKLPIARPACASTPLICPKSVKSAVSYSGSPAGGSRPLICFNLRNRRFSHSGSLQQDNWCAQPNFQTSKLPNFQSNRRFLYSGSPALAMQRPLSSPPRAAARDSTSVAPPSLQTSKPPNFLLKIGRKQSGGRCAILLCLWISLWHLVSSAPAGAASIARTGRWGIAGAARCRGSSAGARILGRNHRFPGRGGAGRSSFRIARCGASIARTRSGAAADWARTSRSRS